MVMNSIPIKITKSSFYKCVACLRSEVDEKIKEESVHNTFKEICQ